MCSNEGSDDTISFHNASISSGVMFNVTVIIVGNRISDLSSNPGQG